MGNTNTTPGKFAFTTFGKYLEDAKEHVEPERRSTESYTQEDLDNMFAIFIEDFLVNNKDFATFDEPTKKRVLGALFFFHCNLPAVEEIAMVKTKAGLNELGERTKYANNVAVSYSDGESVADLCAKFLKSECVWDGTSFLTWSDKAWTRCEGEYLSCYELVETGGLYCDLRNCGLNTPTVNAAIEDMSEFLECFEHEVDEFMNSEKFTATLASIKEKVTVFDKPSLLIPGHSTVFDLVGGGARAHSPKDLILTRLHYDVNPEITSVVKKLVRNFQCEPADLASAIVRCGISTGKRTLTIISGPDASGRTTILRLVRSLFEPFVVTGLDGAGPFDKRIRTCICDSVSLSEDQVAAHPCEHLLVVTRSNVSIDGTFGGRAVTTLKLTGPIEAKTVNPNILEHLCTRLQLGSLLNWCFVNNTLEFEQPRSGRDDMMAALLGALGRGCGDPSCTNCGGGRVPSIAGDPDMPAELLEMLAGGAMGFAIGPDGEMTPERLTEPKQNKPSDSSDTPPESSDTDSMPPLEDSPL